MRAQVVARVLGRARLSPTRFLQLSSLYLWLAVFVAQPHKEERFLYVVYPLFCWHAAITTRVVWTTITAVVPVRSRATPLPCCCACHALTRHALLCPPAPH